MPLPQILRAACYLRGLTPESQEHFLIAYTGASGRCLYTAPVFLKMSEGIFSLEINFLTLSGLFLPVVKEAPLAVCDYPAQTLTSFPFPGMF